MNLETSEVWTDSIKHLSYQIKWNSYCKLQKQQHKFKTYQQDYQQFSHLNETFDSPLPILVDDDVRIIRMTFQKLLPHLLNCYVVIARQSLGNRPPIRPTPPKNRPRIPQIRHVNHVLNDGAHQTARSRRSNLRPQGPHTLHQVQELLLRLVERLPYNVRRQFPLLRRELCTKDRIFITL